MSSLTIKDVRKSFGGVEVLKNINLSAESGEFIALVGPSGCGKSTPLAMIAGLESVTSGEIRIEDRLVNNEAPKDRDIAMVFLSYALYPTMTVRQLHQSVGKTTVYVTHDQVEAMTLASRIAVMFKGVLQQYDTPKTIYEQPVNRFVAGFMGSPTMNFLTATVSPDLGVVLDGGDGAVLPLQSGQIEQIASGQKVIFGVRPEHFSPVSKRRAERKGGQSGIVKVTVDLLEPTGSETIVMAKLGGQDVVIACEPDDTPVVGGTMDLAIDMTKICLFDPQTELRL